MSNYLSPPGVRRRTVVLAALAALGVSLVGCGEGEQPGAEVALPTDPYDALDELRRRLRDKVNSSSGATQKGLDDATATTVIAADSSQLQIESRPVDFRRLSFSLSRPNADWLAIGFSNGATNEGGRYLDATWRILPGAAQREPLNCRVLLTNNPDSASALLWVLDTAIEGVGTDVANDVLDQVFNQAALLMAVESGDRIPALSRVQVPVVD